MICIGRERELELVSQNLLAREIVVLSGPSGIGKTTTRPLSQTIGDRGHLTVGV